MAVIGLENPNFRLIKAARSEKSSISQEYPTFADEDKRDSKNREKVFVGWGNDEH